MIINLFVENKNVFSTISSSNYKEKYKELSSSVCNGFVTRITLFKKSMITITLNNQNWVKPLSGNSLRVENPLIV